MASIAAAIGFLCGLIAAPSLPRLDTLALLPLTAGLAGWALLLRRHQLPFLLAVAFIASVLAIGRVGGDRLADHGQGSVASWAGRGRVTVMGRVVGEPERTSTGVRLHVEALSVAGDGGGAPARGDLVAWVMPGAWRYGDRVAITGEIERPLDTDALPLAVLLGRRGIWAQMRATRAERVSDGHRPDLTEAVIVTLHEIKASVRDALDRRIPAPESALARGLLLGGGSDLPPDIVEAFRRSGMTHVIAVSGYNIGLVAGALIPLAGRQGWFGLLGPTAGVVLFTALVGAPASAVRAAIMAILALVARATGRPADALSGLAIAAIAMTALDPDVLHDLGFQLSSLATLGLILLYPWVDGRLRGLGSVATGWMHRRGAASPLPSTTARGPGSIIVEVLAATLAVEALTLPLTAWQFGRVSLLSPVANALALPMVPLAMLASLPVGLSGALPAVLAAPLGWIAYVPLAWIIAVVEACARPEWASLSVGQFDAIALWAYYAAAGVALLSLHAASYRRVAPSPSALARGVMGRVPAVVAIGVPAAAAAAALAAAFVGPSQPRVTFFEASGSALIQTASGRSVLVDPGADGRALVADLGRTLPFWASQIDIGLLTRDAAGVTDGIPDLLRRYNVRQMASPGTGLPGDQPRPIRWREASAQAGVVPASITDGMRIDLGEGVSLTSISAGEGAALLLDAPSGRIVLLGALDLESQRSIGEALDVEIEVLWVSAEANGVDAMLRERLAPRLIVLSVPRGRRAPPLSADAVSRVERTDDRGSVEVVLAQDGLRVSTRR